MPKRTASAAATSAMPSHPTTLNMRLTMVIIRRALAAPTFAVDRLRGQKETKRDEADVINEVRRVDDAFAEIVEVLDDRQVTRDACDSGPAQVADPVDHPQKQKHAEGEHPGDDLVHRETRDEQPDRDEAAAEQLQPQIRRHN